MTALFLTLWGLGAAGIALRMALARRWFAKPPAPPVSPDVTVMMAILSGDPALPGDLAANLAHAPDVPFLLLIDEDDAGAQALAQSITAPNARFLSYPPPEAGENPKVAKLARALPLVQTAQFAVLDDDTLLPPGALDMAAGALAQGDLVTGLPAYMAEGGFFTRLLAGFVNGSMLITYPVGALLGQQRTLNGMFYLGRTEDLRALGGFQAIRGQLTDDYAMARLYLDAGRRLVQAPIVHPMRTTVTGPLHYLSIMRRWMIFARRYLAENATPFTLGLIGLTTLAPLVLVLLSLFAAPWAVALAIALPLFKAVVMRHLRARLLGQKTPLAQIPVEALADLLVPLHLMTALVRPHAFRWRNRAMRMKGDRITYD